MVGAVLGVKDVNSGSSDGAGCRLRRCIRCGFRSCQNEAQPIRLEVVSSITHKQIRDMGFSFSDLDRPPGTPDQNAGRCRIGGGFSKDRTRDSSPERPQDFTVSRMERRFLPPVLGDFDSRLRTSSGAEVVSSAQHSTGVAHRAAVRDPTSLSVGRRRGCLDRCRTRTDSQMARNWGRTLMCQARLRGDVVRSGFSDYGLPERPVREPVVVPRTVRSTAETAVVSGALEPARGHPMAAAAPLLSSRVREVPEPE